MILVDSDLLANWFLDRSEEAGQTITSGALNCLLYVAHGWALNLLDGPLCKEFFVVRETGPVLPSVEEFAKTITPGWRMGKQVGDDIQVRRLANASENAELLSLLDRIWQQYKSWSDQELRRALTAPSTPWDVVWNRRGGKTRIGMTIPERSIRDAFYAIAILQPPLCEEKETT